MAKAKLLSMDYEEDVIAACMGFTETDDERVLAAREEYRRLVAEYRREIEPEAARVRELGGLFILGTERHESRRIDNQLRGRAGRQGDPGESRFFLSTEDDLMRLFGADRIQGIVSALKIDENMAVEEKLLTGYVERAQLHLEGNHFKHRKYVLAYDDVMNHHRTIIYGQRRQVLDGEDISETIKKMLVSTVERTVAAFTPGDVPDEWDFDGLRTHYKGVLTKDSDFRYSQTELNDLERDSILDLLCERILRVYKEKEELCGAEAFRETERSILLKIVDIAWMRHLDVMDDLKGSVGLQAYAQRDPITEFRVQGAELFENMIEDIRQNTARAILSLTPQLQPVPREQMMKQSFTGMAKKAAKGNRMSLNVRPASQQPYRREGKKIGANDPCPCGSGLKYKLCCKSKRA
jgi:preprotein translocase subunit SecA